MDIGHSPSDHAEASSWVAQTAFTLQAAPLQKTMIANERLTQTSVNP